MCCGPTTRAAGDKRVLLDPGDNPDQIDLTSAQWSPQGDVLLLTGGTSLWLLDARDRRAEIARRGQQRQNQPDLLARRRRASLMCRTMIFIRSA